VPSSLPFFDRETATLLPSTDGTNQSIAVNPFVSSTLGSSSTLRLAGSACAFSVTSMGCCLAGSL